MSVCANDQAGEEPWGETEDGPMRHGRLVVRRLGQTGVWQWSVLSAPHRADGVLMNPILLASGQAANRNDAHAEAMRRIEDIVGLKSAPHA